MKIHVVLWSQRVFFNMKREEQRKRKKRREKTSHFKTYRANQKSRVKVWPCLLIGGIFDYLSIFWLAVINWQVCCDWLLVNRSRDTYHSPLLEVFSLAAAASFSLFPLRDERKSLEMAGQFPSQFRRRSNFQLDEAKGFKCSLDKHYCFWSNCFKYCLNK